MDLKNYMSSKTLPLSCGCHLWVGAKFASGYGSAYVGGKNRKAHRVAYEVAKGVTLQPGEVVRHTCDCPACVNPDHLIPGTSAANSRDMANRGRARNRHGKPRRVIDDATVRQVREMLNHGVTGKEVSALLGIPKSSVSRIKNGKQGAAAWT